MMKVKLILKLLMIPLVLFIGLVVWVNRDMYEPSAPLRTPEPKGNPRWDIGVPEIPDYMYKHYLKQKFKTHGPGPAPKKKPKPWRIKA